MACKLQRVEGQRGVYTPQSIQDLQNFIRDAFIEAIDASDGGYDAKRLKINLRKALYKIGDEYNDLRQINEVIRQVELVVNDPEFEGLSEFLPQDGIYNNVSTTNRRKIIEDSEQELDNQLPNEEIKQVKSSFLDNFLGNKAKLKNLLKQDVLHKLITTFIIDRENGRLVANIGAANRAAREYKLLLFNQVTDYFRTNLPNEYHISDTTLFDGDKYTGILSDVRGLTRYLDDLSPEQLQSIHDSDINKYNAITAWFTLKNFDNFVDLLIGDAIKVNPDHKNSFKDGDGYIYSSKGTQVITSYRKDENIVLENEIGALAQALINSTPFYKKGIDNPTGKFIKFEDFYKVITKLKDLALDPESGKIIVNRMNYGFLFGNDSDLSLQELELIENKSLRSIINNIRINPQVYTRLAMRILIQGDNMNTLGYTEEESDKAYSVYKGFFSRENITPDHKGYSLYTIQHQDSYDHNDKNYYSLITQVADSLFTVNYLQYNLSEDGGIVVRTLHDLASDNIRKRLEMNITGFNSKHIIKTGFEKQLAEPYKLTPLYDEVTKNFTGISFVIPLEEDMVTDHDYSLHITLSDLGLVLTIKDAYDKVLNTEDLEGLVYDDTFRKFIDDLLNLDLQSDRDLLEALHIVYGSKGSGVIAKELLDLATSVYMNKYISNVLLKDVTGKKNTMKKLDNIYPNNELTYNSTLGEINLVSQEKLPILLRIAAAKSITTGEAQSTQVRDAEGNMLSSLTLSRLLGSLLSLWQRIIENPTSAASGFSLLQTDLFKGCYTTKEYKSLNGSKAQTLFTVAESIQGNFLHDFVTGFLSFDDKSGKKIIGNGVVGLLPSVNSDKNTIGRMLLDLSQECKIEGIPSILIQGRNKTWAELTVDELHQIISLELGNSYKKAYGNVISDFKTLQQWLLEKGINVNIDPNTHFRELNEYCEEQGMSTAQWLYLQTLEYNRVHAKPIQLIEQTHYIQNGNGIKFNNTFKALMQRYSDPVKLKEFFDLKRTEMLKSLVEENVEINLFDDASKNSPKTWLRENYPDWVHKTDSDGKIIKNGKMTLAKITLSNGRTFGITSKSDLKQLSTALLETNPGVHVDFIAHPHKLLNPKYGLKIELHPMLDKYNTLDYLFTLEFMIAGVGSHINHPGKAKYKTPIVWAHPAIGKTYALDEAHYGNQILDWDVEFNHRRDAWIAKHSGISKTDERYKAIRNEYMIKWRNYPEYKNFIKSEWARIKQLANSQNKILVASPHMLLELFPEDFNKVITMPQEEFVTRNISRKANDEANSIEWKKGIDGTISQFSVNPVNKSKIITIGSGIYLTDLIQNGTLYNETSQLRENEMQEEAARFLALHKRNVSYTAAMHEFQLGSITGIPTVYNMAIIDDIKAPVYTISGDRGYHAPLDGATFVNPFVVIWENNSLEGDKAGIDKKQFVHFYDEATGTGGIVKTAGFGLTNDRIKRYKFYRDMMYNMTKRVWKNEDGTTHIVREGGILKDFNGKDVDYGNIYFKKGNKYYMRTIDTYLGNNTYSTTLVEVNENGEAEGEVLHNLLITGVDSNYDLWNMFGGHNSLEIRNGKLVPSERSIELTARACNDYGIKKPGINKVMSADDISQPMKHSDIHYMPTVGAIKQGSSNVNPKSCYYGHHELNFMLVKMMQAGIQLDKEHHADKSELSVMTQVISAACANGYSSGSAKRLYDSIYALTKAGTREFRNELGDLLVGDETKFNQAVTGIIMKSMINATSQDGDLVLAIALDLIKMMKTSKDFSFSPEFYKKADQIIPASDPTVYPKIVNMLTVALTKSGIKAKISGILAVLCPSHEILKFYKVPAFDENGEATGKYKRVTIDKLEEFYNTDDIDTILDLLQDEELFLQHPSEIEIGYKYLVTHSDGTQEVIHINRIHGKLQNIGFRNYKDKTLKYSEVSYEDFRKMDLAAILEWVKEGLDLRSYNVRFEDESGNKYQIADLDIVSDYFRVKDEEDPTEQFKIAFNLLDKYKKRNELFGRVRTELSFLAEEIAPLIDSLNGTADLVLAACSSYSDVNNPNLGNQFKEYLSRKIVHFLNREMQLALNGISPSSTMDTVSINDTPVKIKKETIKTSTYGLVMPKTFKTNLGLDEFDDLEDIKHDPMFFVKKLAKKFGTHVESYELEDGTVINNFHLELKKSNGNHIYIREGLVGSDLSREIEWFKRTDELGNVYRVNGDNEIMYQMHSADDKIYIDDEGNEIIVTSGDKVIWTDENNNELDVSSIEPVQNENGVWIDAKTNNKLIRKLDSGILFYLDTMDYSSFNISEASTDIEFLNILNKAYISTNQSTVKLANRIKNWGRGNDTLKLIALRQLVLKMNNYEAMLQDAELKDFAMLHLKELGLQMHTSFLRSLEIIAARIPAQSLQSFMSMQVESYENPDINSAYVSLFQFYLQGSDLDIDAVSLQTFNLGRNGLYVGHSPYYNLNNEDLRKASDLIPFPTGNLVKQSQEVVTDYKKSTLGRIFEDGLLGFKNKFGMLSVFNLNTKSDGTVEVSLNLDSVENIQRFSKFIENINALGFVNTTAAEYQRLINDIALKFADTGTMTLPMIASIIRQVLDIVNTHNMYIEKSKPNKREQIIKNYITAQLREIIDDPINRRQADSSVDVVTGPAKALAKLSPKATVQTTFTPGNVVNKFLSIAENMVGKDGIAICATGLKSFFALTEMYQEILNNGTQKEKLDLLFDVNFGGKTYVGLANGFALNFKSVYEYGFTLDEKSQMDEIFPEAVLDYLMELFWASDAANEMSALLGLSTDNAKELVLAKINAGTASIGMYLYGLSIGIPFNLLYNIMTSPLAFRLTELTKGDMFNDNDGTFNIVGALQYLKEEPVSQLIRFNNVDVSEVLDVDGPVTFFLSQLAKRMSDKLKNNNLDETIRNKGVIRTLIDIFGAKSYDNAKRVINEMRDDVNSLLSLFKDKALFEKYEVAYNQILDFVLLYIDDVNLIPKTPQKGLFGQYDLYEDLETLATGAEEMKQLGKILRLNQEIKTNSYDLIGLVNNIEEAIVRRAKLIKRQLKRKGISKRQFRGSDIAKKIIYCKNLDADLSRGGYRIDFEQFITNPSYAERVISLYDELKQSYNPLKVLKKVPHYKGYSETLLNAYKGSKNKSVKFKVVTSLVRSFCNLYDITNDKLKKQVTKNAERAVDLYLRRSWMKESIKPITVSPTSDKKPIYMFIDSGSESRLLTYKTEIQLGTELGDANFKLWMETVVIPELRKNYPDNLFLNRLLPIVNTRTNLGSVAVNYGLPINMLPKTDYEKDVFNEYKDAFNELLAFRPIYNQNVLDLLFYYSLVSNDGRVGPNSLHGIFEDYVTTHGSKAKDYNSFISKADADEQTYERILSYITDEMLAPTSSPYTSGTRIIKYKDKDTDRIEIYIKDKLEEESSYEDEFNEVPFDDDWYSIQTVLNEWDSRNTSDPKSEIRGFKRKSKNSMHNLDNRNYFYNPVDIEGLLNSQLVVLNLQELELYPHLAKYGITIAKVKDGFGVMDITTNDPALKPVIDRFIEFVKKDKKGILTAMDTKDVNDNPVRILDKKLLDAELEAIENNCI